MDGSINFSGTLAGSIADSGGGGGSTVTITPTYSSGTKLADYTIDEIGGAIFVDLSNYPTNEEIASNHFTKSEVNTMLLNDRQYEDLTFQRRDAMVKYQPKLTAGANISIDANNIISASGGSWNYSTSEVNTGQKWIDGKDIFCRTLQIDNFTINQAYGDLHYGAFNITDYIMGIDKIFGIIDKSYIIAGNDQRGIVSIQPEYPSVLILNNRNISNVTLIVTLEYTKL